MAEEIKNFSFRVRHDGSLIDHDEEREYSSPFKSIANDFMEKHKGQEMPARTRDWVWIIRANIDPSPFEYYEGRRYGLEPPQRWPRSEAQKCRDPEIVQIKVMEREGGGPTFGEIDYEKPCTGRGFQNPDDSPLNPNLGPINETKTEGGWILPRSLSENFNPASPTQRGKPLRTQPAPLKTKCREHWERRLEKYLLQMVLNSETIDWDAIAALVGKPVIECQEKYRELADLPLPDHPRDIWTAKEDAELVRWVQEYGVTDWIRISHFLQHDVDDCQQRSKKLISSPRKAYVTPLLREGISSSPFCSNLGLKKRKREGSAAEEIDASDEERRPLKIVQTGLSTPRRSYEDNSQNATKVEQATQLFSASTATTKKPRLPSAAFDSPEGLQCMGKPRDRKRKEQHGEVTPEAPWRYEKRRKTTLPRHELETNSPSHGGGSKKRSGVQDVVSGHKRIRNDNESETGNIGILSKRQKTSVISSERFTGEQRDQSGGNFHTDSPTVTAREMEAPDHMSRLINPQARVHERAEAETSQEVEASATALNAPTARKPTTEGARRSLRARKPKGVNGFGADVYYYYGPSSKAFSKLSTNGGFIQQGVGHNKRRGHSMASFTDREHDVRFATPSQLHCNGPHRPSASVAVGGADGKEVDKCEDSRATGGRGMRFTATGGWPKRGRYRTKSNIF
ncbi:MAG: hypothetical protein Q9163_005307 [Psora crenata]